VDGQDTITAQLGDVHRRIGEEIERLRVMGLDIEASLFRAADDWSVDESHVRELQQLDFLLQHLAALRDFVASLVPNAAGQVDLAAALRRVPLEALRARLAGTRAPSQGAGGVELF
jgi:hypothetical protein